MARAKGSAAFSGTLEVSAGGALDSRSVVPTKADLTLASNYPYSYVGMLVSVQDEGKLYMLVAKPTTTLANWVEVGTGSGEDNIIEGYYNSLDHLFYEESTFVTPIDGKNKTLYIDLVSNNSYRYSGSIFVRIDEEYGPAYVVEGYRNSSDGLFYREAAYTTPITGVTSVIYIALNENLTYRFAGAQFVRLDKEEPELVFGYYNDADDLMYEEAAFTNAITGDLSKLYIALNTNETYRYTGVAFVRLDYDEGQVVQYTAIPSPTVDILGKIVQYTGATTSVEPIYTNGYFYECIEDPDNVGTYIWVQKDIQPDEDTKIQVSTMPVVTSADEGSIVQFIGTTDPNYTNGFFYECVEDPDTAGTFVWVQKNTQPEGGSSIQVTTMPTATSADVDKVVQYIGVTDSTYTNGFFYKCVNNSGVYSWEQLNVQPEGAVVSSGTMLYATLEAASWSNKSQTVAIPGLIADDAGAIGLLETATAAQVEAARNAIITPTTLVDGYVTFTCENVPDIDIPFGVLIGGAGAGLTSSVTANVIVGAITSGTTLPQGLSFTDFVKRLLIAEVAPTIGFSITKSGYVTYGDSYTETLTLSVSNMGSAKKIKTIAWYEGNTLLQTDTVDSTTTGSWTYTMGTATVDTTTFKAIVTYTKSDDVDTTATKTSTITFCYNKFYGVVSDLNPTEATVEALSLDTTPNKGATYTFTATNGRFCYAYPKTSGALTSIKDGNGFSLLDSFTRTEQSYTQNGTTVVYYRYVLTDATTVSNYKVIFA